MIRAGRLIGSVAAAGLVLTAPACGSGSARQAGPTGHAGSSIAGSSTATAEAHSYLNPVYRSDFPDPSVLRVGATFYAYGTQGGGKNIQALTSPDLVHWRTGPDPLPELGRWASAGSTWAPEVIAIGSSYAMYYVARDSASGRQCIGRATAADPAGPYRDNSAKALVCQAGLGGSIDPDPARAADGSLYLYWKNDGNCCGLPVRLWGQRLSSDGATLTGKPTGLLGNTKAWQGNLVEAPEMVVHDNRYTLFYSANDYASDRYGIGYASCRGPLGPCMDASDAALIPSNQVAAGPGHCFILRLPDGDWWMLYHAWPPDAVGSQSPGRLLWLEPLTWRGDQPAVHPSDAGPQPDPSLRSP
jgi:beta-xylosidase